MSGVSDLLLYLGACGRIWVTVYTVLCLLFGFLGHLTFHLMGVGLLICLTCYFRLPPPDPSIVQSVLGFQPSPRGGNQKKSEHNIEGDVAHRAAGLDAPENTVEAVRLSAQNGANMVEFDISFSSDGTAVAFHDDTVDRVTTAVGPVDSLTLGQLQQLDLATKHPLSANYDRIRIPTVDDFVKECLSQNMKMMIDLKTYDRPDETAALILNLYDKYPSLRTSAIVTSFFPNLLYKIRSINPNIIVSISWRPHFFAFSTWEGTEESMRPRYTGIQFLVLRAVDFVYRYLLDHFLWFFIGISAIAVHRSIVTVELVSLWRSRGVRVFAWTVNDSLEKAYFRHVLGVTCLTDTLDKVAPERWLIEEPL